MAAVQYNTVIEQGASFDKQFELVDGDGVAIPLDGYTFRAQLRRKPLDTGSPVATFTCALGEETNQLIISLSPTQTAAITVDAVSGNPTAKTRYYYDVYLTAPDNSVSRLVEGYVDVSPEVTK